MMGDKPLLNTIRALVHEAAWTRMLSMRVDSASIIWRKDTQWWAGEERWMRVGLSMRLGHCLDAQSASASTMAAICSHATYVANARDIMPLLLYHRDWSYRRMNSIYYSQDPNHSCVLPITCPGKTDAKSPQTLSYALLSGSSLSWLTTKPQMRIRNRPNLTPSLDTTVRSRLPTPPTPRAAFPKPTSQTSIPSLPPTRPILTRRQTQARLTLTP